MRCNQCGISLEFAPFVNIRAFSVNYEIDTLGVF